MAATDLDALVERLRRLPPKQLERVKDLVDELASDASTLKRRFRAFAGCISSEDAESMMRAVEDCERIDERAW
ncbi:MAG: hypothetical protein IPI67_25910 [Myxococcales bacterium]|nr:hypothetical protein [Myxococcales bacterium]